MTDEQFTVIRKWLSTVEWLLWYLVGLQAVRVGIAMAAHCP